MANVELYMDDPDKSVILGLPANQPERKIINPYYEATELERTGKDRKQAERIYLELLNSDFDNPVLHASLGMNYAAAEKSGLAHLLLQSALANLDQMRDGFKRLGIIPKANHPIDIENFMKIKKAELLNAIGTCYKHENNITKARLYFEEAQKDVPINPDIQNNLGTLYINEGKPELAQHHLNMALEKDPNHAQAHWNKSLTMLELGDYANGWTEYDWGLRAQVRVDRNYAKHTIPFWNGEKNARIIVYGEQGIGDEIMFASLLPQLVADAELVVFECHRKLHKLFANSFPEIDIYPTREDENIQWPLKSDGSDRYGFTHKIAIGSLGKFYRRDIADFPGTPFLVPTPSSELAWAERLAKLPAGPKIGISWIGGHKKTRVEVRSMELERLLPILGQNAQFISLQYTPQEDEILAFETAHGIKLHQFPEATYSPIYDDTAGLVANLDLVITVCTSLVHLAGSMGVPTWVMVPSRPAWRYRLDLDGMPWYSSVVLFRQTPDSVEWQPVIDEVASNLSELLQGVSDGQDDEPQPHGEPESVEPEDCQTIPLDIGTDKCDPANTD
jgi:tetratricopeptide (TPR) repeat protein